MKLFKTIPIILLTTFILISCSNNTTAVNTVTETNGNNQNQVVEPKEDPTTEVTESNESLESLELAVGKPFPNYTFETITGENIVLQNYEGQIIMLNFWATWCPYCVEEMPDLNDMNSEEDVIVIGINAREDKSTINNFLDGLSIDFPIVIDTSGYFSEKFYVSSLPTTFFINEEGILLGSISGMLTKEQMQQIIQDIRDDAL